MEKFILIMFHTLFGGAAVLLGGFIGYIFTMKLTGNHELLPFLGFGIAGLFSMVAYMRRYKMPLNRSLMQKHRV